MVEKYINIDLFRRIQQFFSSLVDFKMKIPPSVFEDQSIIELESMMFFFFPKWSVELTQTVQLPQKLQIEWDFRTASTHNYRAHFRFEQYSKISHGTLIQLPFPFPIPLFRCSHHIPKVGSPRGLVLVI